jgi:ribonuclease P protein component
LKNFGLSKHERIKSKKEFDLVYSEGKIIFSKSRKLKALYCIVEGNGLKVAFTTHKKSGKAFWRNRARRLMRDSFRYNKNIIKPFCLNNLLLISFSLNSINQLKYPRLNLNIIKPEIIDILLNLQKELVP